MKRGISFLILGISLLAQADWTEISAENFEVSAPPTQGSAAYKKDFATLLKAQDTRTEEECSLAASQKYPSFKVFFANADLLSASEVKRVGSFIDQVMNLGEKITNVFKTEYQRPRPYDVNTNIEPCIAKPGGSKSYPSSHASMAVLGACVLAHIFPDRAEAFTEHGNQLADLRYIVGVHHPSDVQAGKTLGEEICSRLLQEADFKKELKALKK